MAKQVFLHESSPAVRERLPCGPAANTNTLRPSRVLRSVRCHLREVASGRLLRLLMLQLDDPFIARLQLMQEWHYELL